MVGYDAESGNDLVLRIIMSDPAILANIHEVNTGIYYQVRLHGIPRAGEFIYLWSIVEQLDKNPAIKQYKITEVMHNLYDVTDRVKNAEKGGHFVTLFVVESDSELFSKVNF
jgi:hypothetical protein